jgi:hypothetical protein
VIPAREHNPPTTTSKLIEHGTYSDPLSQEDEDERALEEEEEDGEFLRIFLIHD